MRNFPVSVLDNISIKQSRKIILNYIFHNNDNVILSTKDNLFGNCDEAFAILKNIKTRQEYICPIVTDFKKITMNLLGYRELFTDYEGTILIVIKESGIYSSYLPIVNEKTNVKLYEEVTSVSKDKLKWYFRILPNGEIRLSSIISAV